MNKELFNKIKRLKEEKDAVILAHYYVNGEIQEVADYVGDSYYLSKIAKERHEKTIVFCGVRFMGESAKIVNPDKLVLLPVKDAECEMAYMVKKEYVQEVRKQYDDLAVVCYINSTAEIKSYSDVCVTSANAYNIVRNIKEKNILFIPDYNLGKYLSRLLPEKNFIFNDGFCPIHQRIKKEDLLNIKAKHKEAEILVHPECTMDIVELGDYVGSTTGIINYATSSDCDEFIICTEMGVEFDLKKKNPNKKFYPVIPEQICGDMKKITLNSLYDCLKNHNNEVVLDEDVRIRAVKCLERMHELAD